MFRLERKTHKRSAGGSVHSPGKPTIRADKRRRGTEQMAQVVTSRQPLSNVERHSRRRGPEGRSAAMARPRPRSPSPVAGRGHATRDRPVRTAPHRANKSCHVRRTRARLVPGTGRAGISVPRSRRPHRIGSASERATRSDRWALHHDATPLQRCHAAAVLGRRIG